MQATGHRKRLIGWQRPQAIHPATNRIVAELSDVIFICVRSLDVKDAVLDIEHILAPEKLLVSVAGDVSLKSLRALYTVRTARVFPSMASERPHGVMLLTFGDSAAKMDKHLIDNLLMALGEAIEVPEESFEVLADLTYCATGYFVALMQEFAQAAVRKEVPSELAERLVKQTLLGTALLLEDKSFRDLIASVAIKGGITKAGVNVIQAQAPGLLDQLFPAMQARHEQVKRRVNFR